MATTLSRAQDGDRNSRFVPGQTAAIQSLNALVGEIADTNVPVLVVGESGTGKEVYARLIHRLSQKFQKPFTKLSCRAMEAREFLEKLKLYLKVEDEDAANETGTLFLDGIDELELACQKALLSMLPDGEQQRKGHDQVRLITSASRNLETEVEVGRFRRELFFRINGMCLRLPPLRERKGDIPLMLEHFFAEHAAEMNREVPTLSKEELESAGAHNWPGNVRELENFARKISLFGHPHEAIKDLHATSKLVSIFPDGPPRFSLKVAARAASRQAERELIREALDRTHWNRKRAAQQLNISYKSLLYKIKQTGLEG